MRIRYNPDVDALSVVFRETTVTTKELADGIVAEYDADDRLVGLEIIDVEAQFGGIETFREVVLEGVGLGSTRLGASSHRDDGPSPVSAGRARA